MIDNRTVGRAIASLRQSRNMTQQQLAAALNVSHQAVSKWENGAALPDIQTLVELTKLFGVTMEQLLSGEIPEQRLGREGANPFRDIGNFVGGVIDDIGNLFRSEPEDPRDDAEESDGADEAEVEKEGTEKETGEKSEDGETGMDLEKLLEMAPFMSREAVGEMLLKFEGRLTPEQIARFAPFVDAACLERLIRAGGSDISWDTLRRMAPFLKKEAVDGFARMIAAGEKLVKPVCGNAGKGGEEVVRTIGKGAEQAFRKVVEFGNSVAAKVGEAFDTGAETADERLARLRSAAFSKALEDGRWPWIEAHIAELQDEELRRRISERAHELGMHDWVFKNLGGYADRASIEKAVADGNWGWLGEHAWKFEPEVQQLVAMGAVKAENWQWLSTYAEQLDLTPCVVEIARTARAAGARMLAVQLVHYDMTPEQAEETALDAVNAKDAEFIDLIVDVLPSEAICRCCIRYARSGDWDSALKLAEKLDAKGLDWLTGVAVEAGNFDAIDRLFAMLQTLEAAKEE